MVGTTHRFTPVTGLPSRSESTTAIPAFSLPCIEPSTTAVVLASGLPRWYARIGRSSTLVPIRRTPMTVCRLTCASRSGRSGRSSGELGVGAARRRCRRAPPARPGGPAARLTGVRRGVMSVNVTTGGPVAAKMMLRMKYFVTGGSGFVGRHLLLRLLADGHEVHALARSEGPRGWSRRSAPPRSGGPRRRARRHRGHPGRRRRGARRGRHPPVGPRRRLRAGQRHRRPVGSSRLLDRSASHGSST